MRLAALVLLALATQIWAAEPILGTWLLASQQVNGRDTPTPRPLTLRITQAGDLVEFEYSVAAAQKRDVSLRFAARLDGSPADVRNPEGRKIGTARVRRGGPSEYLIMLEGPNRPTSTGKMTVSADGKRLLSKSDTSGQDGTKLHTIQTFERR